MLLHTIMILSSYTRLLSIIQQNCLSSFSSFCCQTEVCERLLNQDVQIVVHRNNTLHFIRKEQNLFSHHPLRVVRLGVEFGAPFDIERFDWPVASDQDGLSHGLTNRILEEVGFKWRGEIREGRSDQKL